MRLFSTVAWLLFALAALASWLVDGGFLVRAVPPDLGRLPARIGPLALGEALPVEPGALGDLAPERWAYRRAEDAQGNPGVLYVAYYARSRRWSGRPHDVDACYRSLGWRQREARELAPGLWARRFEQDGAAIQVVHWLEHPGAEARGLDLGALGKRLLAPRGLRPDAASIYLELDAGHAVTDAGFVAAARELSAALEELWR